MDIVAVAVAAVAAAAVRPSVKEETSFHYRGILEEEFQARKFDEVEVEVVVAAAVVGIDKARVQVEQMDGFVAWRQV